VSHQATSDATPHAPRWLAFAALPILILFAAKFSIQELNIGFKNSVDITVDFEFLQYILAAGLAYYFGKTGIAIVRIAAVLKLFALDTVIQGAWFQTPGSLGEAIALVLVAQAFGPSGGLSKYLDAPSLAPALSAFILIAGIVGLSYQISTVSLSTASYVLLLLAAFYLGLSQARLAFAIALALIACALSVYLFVFVPGWENPRNLNALFNLQPSNFLLETLGNLKPSLVLLSPFSVLLILYTMGLGRGFRALWLDADEHRSAWPSAIASLTGLLVAATIAFLLWEFRVTASYVWTLPLQPNETEPEYHAPLKLVTPTSVLVIPFIGFTLGAIYRSTGVWAAILCVLIVVFGAQLLAFHTEFLGFSWSPPHSLFFRVYGQLQYLDLGRGLALPAFATLGGLVAERTRRHEPGLSTNLKEQT
jgi:hypothetical protein